MAKFQLLVSILPIFVASFSVVMVSSRQWSRRWKNCSNSDWMVSCPSVCSCQCDTTSGDLKADCSRRNLTKIPENFHNDTTKINLNGNFISDISPGSLSYLSSLILLNLENNRIERLQPSALSNQHLSKLGLNKDYNDTSTTLIGHTVTELWILSMNSLAELTSDTFAGLPDLETLDVSYNDISDIDWLQTFTHTPKLKNILLSMNLLESIPSNSIKNLTSLELLCIDDNRINKLEPNALNNPKLKRLFMGGNLLTHLSTDYFAGLPNLENIWLTNNPIHTVQWNTFSPLPMLRNLILDRCSISHVDASFCTTDTRHGNLSLEKLDLHANAISVLPKLSHCSKLKNLNFGNNMITSLEGQIFRGLSFALDLILKSNRIKQIGADDFTGLAALNYLDLNNNGIEFIHQDAFRPLKNLEELYLASNKLAYLSPAGLRNLIILDTSGNEHLEQIPAPSVLENIKIIFTEHPYHCCEYLRRKEEPDNYGKINLQDDIVSTSPSWSINDSIIFTDYWISSSSSLSEYSDFHSSDYVFSYSGALINLQLDRLDRYISCYPQPGPFMPCSDLFGSWFLRVGVWLVFLLAVMGNGIVIFVIIFSRTKIDVSRFLICNLACADFAMGIYLGFLASVDAATLGVFRRYGVHWQLSAGCGAAGFLAVFSSELSIFTLSVITLERFYAIKHALHLEKRLKLQQAVVYMCFGWAFALTVAMLPLLGVNHYYKYAVCLPFDISTKGALAYASGIMVLNGLAFVVIVMCYISIYCAIQGSLAWNCNDSRVALRMSLLVFTDFICWAPIAIISLTSAFNLNHVSLHVAKILTVFVLPVNSCANPFLYTILTKQFKKDCYMILRCFRSDNANIHQRAVAISAGRATNGSRSLRSSLSYLGFPSCCRTSSSESAEPITPKSQRRYIYRREVHHHFKKTRVQLEMPDYEGNTRSRRTFKRCGCFVPFWKSHRFSKSSEDVSLKTICDCNESKRRSHSMAGDLLFRTGGSPGVIHSQDCFMEALSRRQEASVGGEREFEMSPDNYVVFPSSSKSENRFVLVDGEDSGSTDNMTSSSTKFTILSVEVTKEYDRNAGDSPKSRPTNLRVDCSPPQKQKVEKGASASAASSPTYLSSPLTMSDCSSPGTMTTECWSPTCCQGLSPMYSPGLCPEILVTNTDVPSYGAIDESDRNVAQLSESML